MTTTDVSLLAYVKSLFPFNTDRIQSISREDGKLFVATDDDKRYILKLVELPPIVASVNMGEHQTLFHINRETKEPVYRKKTIHKRHAYKRSVCHKWHVGRGKTTLTDEDKRKLKIKHNIR